MAVDYTIVVDSREQNALWSKDVVVQKLDVGDYSMLGLTDQICIERKSGLDALATAGKGHNRFNKEIERSKALDYFAIVIEEPYRDLLQKKFEGAHYSKMRGFVALKTWFSWHVKHNIPLFFANDRGEAKMIIREIFRAYLENK